MSHFDILVAIELYKSTQSLHKVAKLLHTSHISLSKLFKEQGIKVNNIGKKKDFSMIEIQSMITDYVDNHLTTQSIADKYGIRIKRLRSIFKENGVKISKWNGHIKKVVEKKQPQKKEIKPTIKCPYCEWQTIDINGKSHAFQKHLQKEHKEISVFDFVEKHPNLAYQVKDLYNKMNAIRSNDLVKCECCGKYLKLITNIHLKKHNLTKADYISLYPNAPIISNNTKKLLHTCISKMQDNKDWERFTSKPEKMIAEYIQSLGFEVQQHNFNDIVCGKEIDIYVPQKNLAIEFDGIVHHTENFGGKSHLYHRDKTNECEAKGIRLLHIFENEWFEHREIVLSKIKHILGKDENSIKIMARKCYIEELTKGQSELFLNENHIQGSVSATIYLGAFYENKLVAVMSFKKENKIGSWELTRFASLNGYKCQGIGGKLFSYFIKHYNAKRIKSFADRRWSSDKFNNIYKTLGFQLEKILAPDFKYYYTKDNKPILFHKTSLRKQRVLNKYKDNYLINENMTEEKIAFALGYDRIWDCGLLRYVWTRE